MIITLLGDMVSSTTPLAGIVIIAGIIWVITTAVWALETRTFIPQVVVQGFTNMAPYMMYFRQTNISSMLIMNSNIHFIYLFIYLLIYQLLRSLMELYIIILTRQNLLGKIWYTSSKF
jgi:hypothetical protein